MARQVKSVCAARLQFTVRASDDFLKTGSTLARIDAGSRRVTLSILAGGSLNLYEEVYSSNGSGGGGGGPYGTIFPNDPTTIFIDVDLPSSKLTLGVKSPKVPGETKVIDMIALPPDVAPAITSIELGTTPPGTAVDPQGLYWLDDISID
jgi:hypothetical protein